MVRAAHAAVDGICPVCYPQVCSAPPEDEPGVPFGGPADDGLADV